MNLKNKIELPQIRNLYLASPYQRINIESIVQQSNSVNVNERDHNKSKNKDYSNYSNNNNNNYNDAISIPNLLNNLDDVSSHAPSSVGNLFKEGLKKKLENIKKLNKDI